MIKQGQVGLKPWILRLYSIEANPGKSIAQSAGAVEYTNCFSAKG